jgi:EF hand
MRTFRRSWVIFNFCLCMAGWVLLQPPPASAQGTSSSTTATDAWALVVTPGDTASIIKFFDANGDGKIDRTEHTMRIVAFVSKVDKNRDDALSPDELPRLDKRVFDQIDKNSDGKISAYEFMTAETLQFDVIDANHDQFITADEITEHMKGLH